jgi:hypothetical protein
MRNILTIIGCDASIVGSVKATITHGYTNNNQECTFVSQFYMYLAKL